MAEKLKDKYLIPDDVKRFAKGIAEVSAEFDEKRFLKITLDKKWDDRELKERMRHIALCMGEVLPDFKDGVKILKKAADQTQGFMGIIYSEYVECFGQDDWKRSMSALHYFTRMGSAEFAIRPFLSKSPEKTVAKMLDWTQDKNEHVRRLASEGCRPRLPWASPLPVFKADPKPILPILEALKDDPSEYVRKSVANNLNDISKDHPEIVLDLAKRWLGHSKRTDWIVKHACRTLLKAGNPKAMILFGFADPKKIKIEKLGLNRKSVKIGGEIKFSFEVRNTEKKTRLIRLEYRVDYMKANGKQSPKVFQIKEGEFKPGNHSIERKLSLKNLSIRKHYPGKHGIAIIVNGVEKANASFTLK